MTCAHLTRRDALGLLGTVLVGGGLPAPRAWAAAARPGLADPAGPYQVPGGRIAFQRPAGIAPTTNGWILQSEDHTFQVRVQEMTLVPGQANALWDKDPRSFISATPAMPGFSARRFKNMRYGTSPDNGTESLVLTDGGWAGEVTVLISNLSDEGEAGGAIEAVFAAPAGGGLIARWQAAAEFVLAGVNVRAAPAADVALKEFGVTLDAQGLNPRFSGDRLVLSAQAPRTGAEGQGAGMAHISLPGLSNLDYITADANDELFDFFKLTGTELSGAACRGVQADERRLANGLVTTGIRAFGKRRQQEITAVYPAAERTATLAAMARVFASLRFLDEA